ncbi:NUDIX hydrolase [Spirosoma linguale]|uniref:NUDIX hydrolase n=1 Tax=Spirosoma linguale (strain ATCC 33905 / DSM 74 / LMG 10896 / Claus 1) TaxID=504472 RepID=D2QHJ0_SPILD|nr:NUDIX hydrolase [Spirosoma linguale DSM 74]
MQHVSQQAYMPQLSIDCVIFGYQAKQLKVLIPKLDLAGEFWTLPSGFVYQYEDIDEAAIRILGDRTGINDIYLEQFRVFGKASRDNGRFIDRLIELNQDKLEKKRQNPTDYEWITKRFISIGFYALVDINKVIPQKTSLDATIDWYDIHELPTMILDHNDIVQEALSTLRRDLDQKLIAYNLLPETFTMKELQQLYEAIYDQPFAANNFPRKILEQNVLERLEKKFTGAANKAPYLYRLRQPSVPDSLVTQ